MAQVPKLHATSVKKFVTSPAIAVVRLMVSQAVSNTAITVAPTTLTQQETARKTTITIRAIKMVIQTPPPQRYHQDHDLIAKAPHYDNQCPNNNGGHITQTGGKIPSRPCRHCQELGHFDSACPKLNGGSRFGRPLWNWGNLPFNQPCPICGQAHQADQFPNRPQHASNQ